MTIIIIYIKVILGNHIVLKKTKQKKVQKNCHKLPWKQMNVLFFSNNTSSNSFEPQKYNEKMKMKKKFIRWNDVSSFLTKYVLILISFTNP